MGSEVRKTITTGVEVPVSCVDFCKIFLECPDFPDQNQAFSDFCDHDDPSLLSRPKRRWRDQNIATHIWYVQTFATKFCHFQTFAPEKLIRLLRPQRIRRDTAVQETARPVRPTRPSSAISRLSRPTWRWFD